MNPFEWARIVAWTVQFERFDRERKARQRLNHLCSLYCDCERARLTRMSVSWGE